MSETGSFSLSQGQIIETLAKISDPELKAPITELGMVGAVDISGNQVTIEVKSPLPNSPGEATLKQQISSTIEALDSVESVTVNMRVMSDQERMELADRLHKGNASSGDSGSDNSGAFAKAEPLRINSDKTLAETDPRRKEVAEALAKVQDPELHRSLTELGMIKSIGISEGDVVVEVLLTVPGCPLKDKITSDVEAEVRRASWVQSVTIRFGVMSEEQRRKVAEMMRGSGVKEPAPWKSNITTEKLAKRVIVVCSGKGGVGKSTTTTNLAFALAEDGYEVGILDADVYGFSIPRMSGIHGKPEVVDNKLSPLRKGRIQVMSVGYFVDEDAPVIWRGPMLHKAINQFLSDVLWDKLDFLLIDMPPGTGDVTLTIAQALPDAEMLIITTPQPVATHVAGRVARLAERTKMKVLGVIENMSYYEVDGRKDRIFGEGGGKTLAESLNIPFLGEIPLDPKIRQCSDEGKPITMESATDSSVTTNTYREIAKHLVKLKPSLILAQ